MAKRRLTQKRARIIIDHLVPLLESNLQIDDGDLGGAYQQYTYEELQAAVDCIFQWASKQLKDDDQETNDSVT